ncbi:MAG TPA: glycosyltransferase family 1 protein, partial [Solirubrobacteraceae bacterium]|nr:glycosyltransferase family 1 protein [Solirubrobacteraceae bacterium]
RFRERTGAEHGLVLAGAPGWMHEPVIEAAQRTEGVQLAGYVAEEDLPALYALASAFVFMSSYEGFGLPLLEAMACGTPVISSNVTAMPEVVGGDGLLVDEISADALAEQMERLAGDDALAEDLRRRGLARASTFTWERTARRCAELYAERASTSS